MTKKKNPVLITKIVIDIVMILLLITFYQKMAISMSFHELGGLAFFLLFMVHNILNFNWIKSVTTKLFKKSTSAGLRVSWVVNFLLFISMLVIIITGLMINKTLPFKLSQISGAKSWHYFFAALSIILMGIHLGFHWQFIKGLFLKFFFVPAKIIQTFGIIVLTIIIGFGGYSIVTGSVSNWITGPFISRSNFSMSGVENNGLGNGKGFPTDFTDNNNSSTVDINQDDVSNANPMPDINAGPDANGKPDFGNLPDIGEMKGQRPSGDNFGPGKMGKSSQSGSITRVLSVMATYGSEMILFASITAFICGILRKKRDRA